MNKAELQNEIHRLNLKLDDYSNQISQTSKEYDITIPTDSDDLVVQKIRVSKSIIVPLRALQLEVRTRKFLLEEQLALLEVMKDTNQHKPKKRL